jgi:hypothetical protein
MVSVTRIDTSTCKLIDTLSAQIKRKVSLLLDRKQDEERKIPLDKAYAIEKTTSERFVGIRHGVGKM